MKLIDQLLSRFVLGIWVLIIFFVILLYSLLEKQSHRETVEFSAALSAAAGAIYTIALTVQSRRSSNAARFAERWNDSTFSEKRAEVAQAVNGQKQPSEINSRNLMTVLNYFEEMAIVVEGGDADEEMLKKFFRSPVINGFSTLKPWIDQQRQERHQPTLFKEFERLAQRWTDV